MKCEHCGEVCAQSDARFCSSCGKSLARKCRACGQDNAAGNVFCVGCGMNLLTTHAGQQPSGSTIRIGDVGLFKGSIDTSVHETVTIKAVDRSTHLADHSVHIDQRHFEMHAEATPGLEQLSDRLRCALLEHDYSTIADLAKAVLAKDPSNGMARTYLATSLLVTAPAVRSLHFSTVKEAEGHLAIAFAKPDSSPLAAALLAILRLDYYELNCVGAPSPSLAELTSRLSGSCSFSSEARQVLATLRISKRAATLIGI